MKKATSLPVLTEEEMKIVKVSLNYDDLESQLSDNYTNLSTSLSFLEEEKYKKALRFMLTAGYLSLEDVESARECGRNSDDLVVYVSDECLTAYYTQKKEQAAESLTLVEKVQKVESLKEQYESMKTELEELQSEINNLRYDIRASI